MKWKLTLAITCLSLLLMLSMCKDQKENASANVYLNHDSSVNYVGIEQCKSCHFDKFVTFSETGMGRSFKIASLLKSNADFKNIKAVYDKHLDFYYLPFAIDSNLYIKEFRLLNGDTVHSRIEKISYIVGSGHHTNSHFIEENGYIYQAPLTFYTQIGKWDLPPGFEEGNNTRFSRKIGLECMSCHNAIPELIPNSINHYRDLPHGIDCERCHGPGELHVNQMKSGNLVDVSKHIDYSIVNPAKLSWQRQIDVCQRCHLQGNAVLKPGKTYTDFRPGMNLSSVFDQFSPEYEGGDEFVMAAHAERFQQSKCFISSVKINPSNKNETYGFTCISCHNPHVSVKQTNHQIFNQKCVSCHSESNQKACSDLPTNINNKNNNCVECHMPSSGTSDIPHVTVHDHYIRKSYQKSNQTGQLKGLKCVTNNNPDINTVTEAYTSYYEKFDDNPIYLNLAKQNSKKLNKDSAHHLITLIHLFYIEQNYSKIIELSLSANNTKDAWTAYRIGKAFERKSQYPSAITWLEKAVELQTFNLDFNLQLAYLYIKTDAYKKAELSLLKINDAYSKNDEVWACLGLVYLKNLSYAKAKSHFIQALKLNPDLILALQNLRNLEEILGNAAEVEKLEKRILIIQNKAITN